MPDFTDTREWADYEEFTTPREHRARQLWGQIKTAKAAGLPHEELNRERDKLVSECHQAQAEMERAADRWDEARQGDELAEGLA